MDGYEFCACLQSDATQRQRYTVVIMSALDHLARAASLHADASMSKPFNVDDIMDIIQTYMQWLAVSLERCGGIQKFLYILSRDLFPLAAFRAPRYSNAEKIPIFFGQKER